MDARGGGGGGGSGIPPFPLPPSPHTARISHCYTLRCLRSSKSREDVNQSTDDANLRQSRRDKMNVKIGSMSIHLINDDANFDPKRGSSNSGHAAAQARLAYNNDGFTPYNGDGKIRVLLGLIFSLTLFVVSVQDGGGYMGRRSVSLCSLSAVCFHFLSFFLSFRPFPFLLSLLSSFALLEAIWNTWAMF